MCCYSKKSVGNRVIFNHNNDHNPVDHNSSTVDTNYPLFNSEEGIEDYIVHKSPSFATSRRLSSAGAKTF